MQFPGPLLGDFSVTFRPERTMAQREPVQPQEEGALGMGGHTCPVGCYAQCHPSGTQSRLLPEDLCMKTWLSTWA